MKNNPPAAADAPQLAKFAKIGIVPGKDFDASKLKADFAKRIPEVAFDRIMLQFKVNKDDQGHQRLGLHDQDRHLRYRLSDAGARHRDRARRQSSAGCGLSDLAEGRRRQGLRRRQQVRDPLSERPAAAGERLLVDHDVRRRVLLRRQSDQPLLDQRAAESEGRIRTARSTSTFRRIRRARTRNRTGCRRRPASSS